MYTNMKTVVSHIIGSGRQSLRIHFKRVNFHACVLCAVSVAIGSFASTGEQSADTNKPALMLGEMSIEELVNLQITSVSRRQTPLVQSPAAVAVLTGDDIRRLGAQSIPEALRAVPGLQVARISASKWAISSRGFNDEYANKLLVLVDGRTVYTPTFGGVYWNVQDVVLEDLDRIEVIRGPGATLWGANAVNGVINIITKSARETQGALVSSSFGTEDRPSVSARYGGQLSSNVFYRVYVNCFDRAGFDDASGRSMSDEWNMARGGFRLDWEPDEQSTFTLLGDYYDGSYGEQVGKSSVYPATNVILGIDAPASGGNVLGRWTRRFSDESELKLQIYYDHYQRELPYGGGVIVAAPNDFEENQNLMGERRDTWDLDLQHRFALGQRQSMVWGVGYRRTEDKIASNGVEIFWSRTHSEDDLFSAFVQNEITLVEDRLRLTLGSKFEHNDYTGYEVQPTARLLWTPAEHQTYWASVARAVRTPTRMERDSRVNVTTFVLPDSTPGIVSVFGNPNLDSEEVLAYEIGWRFEPARRLSFDVAAFFNDYQLAAAVPSGSGYEPDPPPPHALQSYAYMNDISGHTYGVELLAQWQATERWRLTAGYNWLQSDFDNLALAQSNPEHQFNVRSSVDLGRGWEFNAAAYFVDEIQSVPGGTTTVTIPAYARLDLGLTWRPNSHLELSIWGQNLLDEGHPEFASYKTSNVTEIPRSIYGQITWRF
jgi:iron complex outermembrane recepter protein